MAKLHLTLEEITVKESEQKQQTEILISSLNSSNIRSVDFVCKDSIFCFLKNDKITLHVFNAENK